MNTFVDLDGTLLDSRPRLHRLFCDLSGQEMDFGQYWVAKREGGSNQQLLAERYGWEAAAIAQFTSDWMTSIEAPEYLALDRAFDFSLESLKRLAQDGPVWVLTSRQQEAGARSQVNAAGFADIIEDVLVTGRGVAKAQLCRQRGLDIGAGDRFVGDTGDDIALARGFGAKAIAVCSGFRSRAYLERRNPDELHEDLGTYSRALA